jgi:hypothetical protein
MKGAQGAPEIRTRRSNSTLADLFLISEKHPRIMNEVHICLIMKPIGITSPGTCVGHSCAFDFAPILVPKLHGP